MCGFCGVISAKPNADPALISKMLGPLEPRGPDASGAFVQGKLGFGHRRLSILDLAPTSEQPMIDPDLGLGIVFNGCIYNFKELRRELLDLGYRFSLPWSAQAPFPMPRTFGGQSGLPTSTPRLSCERQIVARGLTTLSRSPRCTVAWCAILAVVNGSTPSWTQSNER